MELERREEEEKKIAHAQLHQQCIISPRPNTQNRNMKFIFFSLLFCCLLFVSSAGINVFDSVYAFLSPSITSFCFVPLLFLSLVIFVVRDYLNVFSRFSL